MINESLRRIFNQSRILPTRNEDKKEQEGPKVKVLVPSDVSILERRMTTGRRKMTLPERFGLMTVFPIMYRKYYSKNTADDIRSILTKHYDISVLRHRSDFDQKVVDIILARQRGVSRNMVVRFGGLLGAIAGPALSLWTMKDYDIKGKSIPLPFLMYGGNITGRLFGGLISGKWSAYKNEDALARLPAYTFLDADANKNVPEESNNREDFI